MPEPHPTERAQKSGCRWLLLGLVLVPVVFLLVVAAWWFGRNAIAARTLETRIDELRAQGEPVDDETLQRYYDTTTDPSLTLIWQSIQDQLNDSGFDRIYGSIEVLASDGRIPAAEQPWAGESIVRDYLANHRSLVELIDSIAGQTESVRFPIEFDSLNTLLPNAQHQRSVARLLTLRHQLACRDRDGTEATASILSLLAVMRSTQRDPLLISQLISFSTFSTAMNELRFGLADDLYDCEQLQSILEALERVDNSVDVFRVALSGERAMALTAMMNSDVHLGQVSSSPRPTLVNRPHDALATLDFYERVIPTLGSDLLASHPDLVQLSFQLEFEARQAGVLQKLDTSLTQLLQTNLENLANAYGDHEQSLRLAKTAILVRLARYEHDRWPASLDELAQPEMATGPLQPLGGKPFGYRIEPDDCVLLWGFSLTEEFQAASTRQTPDEPPIQSSWEESGDVFRIRAQ